MILRKRGIKAGLFRPKSLSPFPENELVQLAGSVENIGVVELNSGMMAEDVERICGRIGKIFRCNWMGGIVPSATEVAEKVESFL